MDDLPTTPFCDVCKAMFTNVFNAPISMFEEHIEMGETKWTIEGPHHKTSKDALASAASGCGICFRMSNVLLREMSEAGLIYTSTRWKSYDLPEFQLIIEGGCPPYQQEVLCLSAYSSELEEPLRPIQSTNTGSVESLERARAWYKECLGHHSCYVKHTYSGYNPPRLLEIDAKSVRLVEAKEHQDSVRYATLSYCWGPEPQHLTLTTDRLDLFRRGLNISELSRTFREAMSVAQSLNIHHIWIDALCILQSGDGHVEDWQEHLIEMGQIYENGTLNIAVDHGKDAEAGCFVPRNPHSIGPCFVDVLSFKRAPPTTSVVREPAPLFAASYRLWQGDDWQVVKEDSPLMRRGWVQQERLLSPRILHFGMKQLVWECTGLLDQEAAFPDFSGEARLPAAPPFSVDTTDTKSWFKIVEAYSKTSLTKSEDRLPALAGIARRIAEKCGVEYAAGMFVDVTLPRSLLYSYGSGSCNRSDSPYRAPSWSWASRDAGLGFFIRRENITEWESFAIIGTIAIQYVDENNPFGQVKGGSMTITAPLLNAALPNGEDIPSSQANSGEYVPFLAIPVDSSHGSLPPTNARLFWDLHLVGQSRRRVRFLCIGLYYWVVYGLLIVPAEDMLEPPRCWRRISMFYVQRPFDGVAHDDDDHTPPDTWHDTMRSYLQDHEKTTIVLI